MDSKQRTNLALQQKFTSKPPLGFFAIDSCVAEKVLGRKTYWRNKYAIKIALWDGRRSEVVESLINDGIALYKKLDCIDIVSVFTARVPPKDYEPEKPKKIDDTTWEDRAGKVYKYTPDTNDVIVVHDPSLWTKELNVESESWDGRITPPDESEFEVIDALIAELGKDRFILGDCAPPVSGWYLFGNMERGFMEMASYPEEITKIYSSLMKKAIVHNKYYIRKGQDGVLLGDDYSSTKGPMISPAMYRCLFLEFHKERIGKIQELGYPVVQHSCGNNWDMLDIFVEMGIDCYQSIQASAGMDIVEVQKRYGDKFSVWGGVKTENLIGGTPQDIRDDIRRFMNEVVPIGGCILGTTHSVCTGTKYENFMVLLEEHARYN